LDLNGEWFGDATRGEHIDQRFTYA
jgi:hypothetical protein